jgi:hypothetical protein
MKPENIDKILGILGYSDYDITLQTQLPYYEKPMVILSHASPTELKKIVNEMWGKVTRLEYHDFVSESDKPSILITQDEFEDFLISKYMEMVEECQKRK